MTSSRYETHKLENHFLPFIYHPIFTVNHSTKIPNWHKNIEILQCIEGEGFVRCDKTLYPLCQNSLLIVNSDVLHTIGSDGFMQYRCLIVDNEFLLANAIPAERLVFDPMIDSMELVSAFNAICASFDRGNLDQFQSVSQLRCDVLQFCIRLCSFAKLKQIDAKENNYVKEVIEYIRSHLSEPISLEQLSRKVGVSQYHLSRQFKHYTGNTILQTINQIRCMQALRMLEQGSRVSAAADACGFPNHSYFSKTFKALIGKLPSEI